MGEFHIDPAFSVYRLVERKRSMSTVISHRRTMSIVSYLIEETARTDRVDNVIFAGFQYMSKFKPQIRRYREIARRARHVYVFGVMDEPLPAVPNITYVPIMPYDQLAKEWFVVSHGPELSTALATEELSDFHDPDHERRFNGYWIFDDAIVQIMHDWLSRVVDDRQEVALDATPDTIRHQQILRSLLRRSNRLLERSDLEPMTRRELRGFLQDAVHPALAANAPASRSSQGWNPGR